MFRNGGGYMKVYITSIGKRKFLNLGDDVIPVDRIKSIDLDAPNGGCDNSVRVITDDPKDDYIWAYENADAIRSFLESNSEQDDDDILCKKGHCFHVLKCR